MTESFYEVIVGVCRICGKAVKIAWTIAPEDMLHITEKCEHIPDHYDGLENLKALLKTIKTILTTKEAAEILGIGLHGVIAAIKRELLLGATKLGTGKRGTWAIPLDAVLKYKAERRSPGRPKRKPPAPTGGLQ